MNDLIITIRKAACLFGHSSDATEQAITAVWQINQRGYVANEDMMRLGQYIPGSYRVLARHMGLPTPADLCDLLNKDTLPADRFFALYNTAITTRYPDLAGIVLPPTENDWNAVEGLFYPMMDWIKQALNARRR